MLHIRMLPVAALLTTSAIVSAKAFPTAEGPAAGTPGGRGGRVLFVTNLNDAGPGSLREALGTKGPRTILFRVAGTIHLKSKLLVREPFFTLAGQSAPGDGVCLADYELQVQTHDAIIRHVRVRPGDTAEGERDAITLRSCDNVIVDHCSSSWSIDECLSTTKSSNVTVQWCILAEALHRSHHHKGNHGYGSILEGKNIAYHHNLYAHNRSRNPRPESGAIDFRNNVVYDWDGNAGYAEGNTHTLNFISNYYIPGPSTKSGAGFAYHTGGPKTTTFFAGNVLEGVVKPGEDDGKILEVRKGGLVADKEFPMPAIKTEPAADAYERVLASAGATLPKRDATDARVIEQVRTRTGRQINSQNEVGGWPDLQSADPPADSDNDGIPDRWELQHHLDPNDPADANRRNEDGYTHLEVYLNGL